MKALLNIQLLKAMRNVSIYKRVFVGISHPSLKCSMLRNLKLELDMINKFFILAFLSVLFFGTAIASSPAEEDKLLLKADQGDAVAQFTLGEMYEKGQGVKQDYVEAVKWYDFAAYQGYAPAQYNFGLLYENGIGVSKNYPEAVKWYRLAAEQGLACAQLKLGMIYENGQGVSKNYPEAVKWYRLAAEQGLASAQINLGMMYEHGKGVAKNTHEASKWYGFAAKDTSGHRGVAYIEEIQGNGFVN